MEYFRCTREKRASPISYALDNRTLDSHAQTWIYETTGEVIAAIIG